MVFRATGVVSIMRSRASRNGIRSDYSFSSSSFCEVFELRPGSSGSETHSEVAARVLQLLILHPGFQLQRLRCGQLAWLSRLLCLGSVLQEDRQASFEAHRRQQEGA